MVVMVLSPKNTWVMSRKNNFELTAAASSQRAGIAEAAQRRDRGNPGAAAAGMLQAGSKEL
jgi:hypothetical protein